MTLVNPSMIQVVTKIGELIQKLTHKTNSPHKFNLLFLRWIWLK